MLVRYLWRLIPSSQINGGVKWNQEKSREHEKENPSTCDTMLVPCCKLFIWNLIQRDRLHRWKDSKEGISICHSRIGKALKTASWGSWTCCVNNFSVISQRVDLEVFVAKLWNSLIKLVRRKRSQKIFCVQSKPLKNIPPTLESLNYFFVETRMKEKYSHDFSKEFNGWWMNFS